MVFFIHVIKICLSLLFSTIVCSNQYSTVQYSEKERGMVWKDYMERIMNEKIIGIIMWKEMQ